MQLLFRGLRSGGIANVAPDEVAATIKAYRTKAAPEPIAVFQDNNGTWEPYSPKTLLIQDEDGTRLLLLNTITESEDGERIDIYRSGNLPTLWYRDPETVQGLWQKLNQLL